MNDDKYPRVRLTNLFGPARYEASERGLGKVVPADAIVIERESLPEVTVSTLAAQATGNATLFVSEHGDSADIAERLRSDALAILALSEYRREHPPVDEAEVEALGQILSEEDEGRRGHDDASWADIARRLLATGRVHVDTEDGAL